MEHREADFRAATLKLLATALFCGVFTGVRGGLFTVTMTRLNLRIRQRLFGSLLQQDIGWAAALSRVGAAQRLPALSAQEPARAARMSRMGGGSRAWAWTAGGLLLAGAVARCHLQDDFSVPTQH
jgi:hypothetical protein